MNDIPTMQSLLREDIVDKILKRDMTVLFGIRQVAQLEQLFLYLCLHDGSILDFAAICESLEVKRPTVERYLSYFESTHLLTRLRPFGYGKEILRGRSKFYLADPAITSAIFLRGIEPIDDASRLGVLVESATFKHLTSDAFRKRTFSFWRGRKDHKVDIITETGDRLIPFEIKYRSQKHTTVSDIQGLLEFCHDKRPALAFVVTKEPDDIGRIPATVFKIIKIPAPLACYILGRSDNTLD